MHAIVAAVCLVLLVSSVTLHLCPVSVPVIYLMPSPLPSYFMNSLWSNYYFMPLFNSLVFNISSLTSLFKWCEKNGAKFIIYLINSGLGELNFVLPFSDRKAKKIILCILFNLYHWSVLFHDLSKYSSKTSEIQVYRHLKFYISFYFNL